MSFISGNLRNIEVDDDIYNKIIDRKLNRNQIKQIFDYGFDIYEKTEEMLLRNVNDEKINELKDIIEKLKDKLQKQTKELNDKYNDGVKDGTKYSENSFNIQIQLLSKENELIKKKLIEYETELEDKLKKQEIEVSKYLKQEIDITNKQVDNIIKERDELKHELKQKEKEYKNMYEELILNKTEKNNEIKELKQSLEIFYEKFRIDNQMKCKMGEYTIQEILRNYFKGAIVEDMSNYDGMSDISFQWDNLSLLVESKTKVRLTNDDIIKFRRDVSNRKNDINGAILVNMLDSLLVDGNSDFYFEISDSGIPLVYVADILNKPYVLSNIILVLRLLIKKGFFKTNNHNSSNKDEIVYNCIKEIVLKKSFDDENIQTLIGQYKSIGELIKNMQEQRSNSDKFLDTIILQYPEFKLLLNEGKDKLKPKQITEDFIIKKGIEILSQSPNIGVKELQKKLGINNSTFYKFFKNGINEMKQKVFDKIEDEKIIINNSSDSSEKS